MKKLLLLFSLLIFAVACSTVRDINKKVYVSGFIFTKYTAKGFLFTPEKYAGKYNSVGIISIEIFPQIHENEFSSLNNQYGTTQQGSTPKFSYKRVDPGEALDSMYNYCKRLGADAVINLEINQTYDVRTGISGQIPGLKISGFAIKRLD